MIKTTFILAAVHLAVANDSYLGTDGGNIYPQKSGEIQMVREDVSISLDRAGGQVECKFWFVNHGPGDTVHVGFPDVAITMASVTEPARNFQAWVQGMAAKVRRDSLVEAVDSLDTVKTSWYHWQAYFPKGDTVLVRNRYSGSWGGSYCEKSFRYIIGTGNRWKGPIRHGRVVVAGYLVFLVLG